jgi:hypothetical protein
MDEPAAGLAKAFRRLLLADAERVDPLLPDARSETREVAVRGDQAEAVEAAGVQEVHGQAPSTSPADHGPLLDPLQNLPYTTVCL